MWFHHFLLSGLVVVVRKAWFTLYFILISPNYTIPLHSAQKGKVFEAYLAIDITNALVEAVGTRSPPPERRR